MGRKVISVCLSLAMVLGLIVIIDVSIDFTPNVRGTTLYVNTTGSGGAYTSIQDAINASKDGDTVFVYNGTYYENVVVNKTINLTGENRDATIIDGDGIGTVVYVNVSWVNFTGFNVTGSGSGLEDAGLKLDNVHNCTIFQNNFTSAFGYQIYLISSSITTIKNNNIIKGKFGVFLVSSTYNYITNNNANLCQIYLSLSSDNTIQYNNISEGMWGITLDTSFDNIIAYNNVSDQNTNGILILKSSRNNLTSNNITDCDRGISLSSSSKNNTIIANNISSNTLFLTEMGIIVASSSMSTISDNNVSDSENGIYLVGAPNSTISRNKVSNNWEGISLRESSNCTITNNNVSSNIDNGINVHDSFKNIVTSNNVSLNEHIGINIWNSSNNTVKNNNVYLNGFEGIFLGQALNNNVANNNISKNEEGIGIKEGSSDNLVMDNNISFNLGFGIILISSSNNSIINNDFIKDGVYILGSELYHFNTHNISINNTVNGKPLRYYKDINGMNIDGDIINVGELILANCTDINAENLQINKTDVGIEVAFSENCNITNNDISSNDVEGIAIMYSHNNTITQNNITEVNYEGDHIAQSLIDGIFLYSSSKNNISNNNISNNSGLGIYIRFSINNAVSNNILSTNSTYGLLLETSSSNNTIIGNVVLNNNIVGILVLSLSSNNTIIDNKVTGNLFGIAIVTSSNNTVISNSVTNNEFGIYLDSAFNNLINTNNISNNGTGIFLDSSYNNTIIYNNVSGNSYGINLTSSSDNKIYHNNFISNTEQADDNRSDNYWDNGYPSGGNYWSDYAGVDNFRGPAQDQPGRDSIGDTNYSIDSDSVDNYPLMNPYPYEPLENYTILKQGWNLISIPLIQIDQNLTKVLEMIDGYYDAVQWYNNSDPNDPWKHNKVGKPYGNDLFELNESMGFWIHITQSGDTIFIYNGTQPTVNQTIILHPGWNLVGYPSITNYNRTVGLNNLTFDTHIDAIWTYNAATQKWKKIEPSDNFEIGRGYWIHAKTKCEWEVPL